MNYIKTVKEFHEAFGHPIADNPSISDADLNKLRVDLIYEELLELSAALGVRDKQQSLDALCDLQYVLSGAIAGFGFSDVFDAAFAEVHRSNMSKLGQDGKPIYRADGKILKGPNYQPPQLGKFIKA